MEACFLRFHRPALRNFNNFNRDPIFDELVCCEECNPTELYFFLVEIYLEKDPYPTDSNQNGSHWLKIMLQALQISTQGLEKFHYHGQIFRIQFAGLLDRPWNWHVVERWGP